MRIAVQMDSLEVLDQATDSTVAIIVSACARGMSVWTYQPDMIRRDEDAIRAVARPAAVSESGVASHAGDAETLDLRSDVDVVLIRQDPPVDAVYRTAAHLLSLLRGDTLVVNDPEGILASPEKVLPLAFPDLMPATMLTRSVDALQEFRARHGRIVLKPLHGHGGSGIFLIGPGEINFEAALDMLLASGPYPIVAQEYLEAVLEGDKRILLIGGDQVGAINRRPAEGSIRANMVRGGTAERTELSEADRHICERIGGELRRRGLIFAGIDVIGGKLTEINVTSPTGLLPLRQHCGIDAAALFWDYIESLL